MTGSNADRLGRVSTAEDDRGTPAATWAAHRMDLPTLDVDAGRIVVVAPHPDDEILGVGGLAAALCAAGVAVEVVAVTDGEAAYASLDPGALAQTRTRESEEACRVLGLPAPVRLGLPDGAVGDHEEVLARELGARLGPGDICLATWRGDGHPDHEAVGRAAAAACGETGARLAEYPVWMWHWAAPDDRRVPWLRARAWHLGPAEVARKADAVRCFVSQLQSPGGGEEPILPPFVIDRLVTDREVVFW